MQLETNKCAILHIERVEIANTQGIDMRNISQVETYRYLNISQNKGIDDTGLKP